MKFPKRQTTIAITLISFIFLSLITIWVYQKYFNGPDIVFTPEELERRELYYIVLKEIDHYPPPLISSAVQFFCYKKDQKWCMENAQKLATHHSPIIRTGVAKAMAYNDSDDSFEIIQKLRTDSDEMVRAEAIIALGGHQAEEFYAKVIELQHSVETLSNLEKVALYRTLLFFDKDNEVKQHAFNSLLFFASNGNFLYSQLAREILIDNFSTHPKIIELIQREIIRGDDSKAITKGFKILAEMKSSWPKDNYKILLTSPKLLTVAAAIPILQEICPPDLEKILSNIASRDSTLLTTKAISEVRTKCQQTPQN
ncbi:MAG: hypothetical protein A2504_12040 [Bdellovibrionales bacterium RIFOXYD12_FULL_39_22]|nr:MAG: hypothetical protein A2385_16555 [Bdellovibrionales bacterium RIFOXYB1_FULL_39_21]OFZ44433.1 MAG: hypothetical protein A2485_06340 [Bdellovibrionales bacterium RIFOXYC12_FULL_39_17]OFZ49925.1 MAG: hypothetical protein A2404_01125 [Bdellovibrionales bacterium RIFOXYC1_FULL_39_130]OFZ76930.1 MAG: hypothetical protein A2560_05925 [Bdellovibrionales bacterium RIFOXYD1_FULL_39_84]OFZ95857.1 MAG: hypothetical protein A2504_12040 [Bdellovibrionales bacterium RIFOXYD12_FULL_39_22]HLE10879.1 HE